MSLAPLLATDPPVSEAQRRAMEAAAHGHSTLGIPRSVGEEFVGHDAPPAGPHAAGILYVAPDGHVLLMRRSETETNYAGHWALPGGRGEPGEAPEATALREAREEMGGTPGGHMRLIDRRQTPNGMTFHTFAHVVGDKFAPKLNPEHSGFAWAPLSALPQPVHPAVQATITERLAHGRPATDMTPEDWTGLRDGLLQWMREEAAEPEHQDLSLDAVFSESDHPRGAGGQFGSGSGSDPADRGPVTVSRAGEGGLPFVTEFMKKYGSMREQAAYLATVPSEKLKKALGFIKAAGNKATDVGSNHVRMMIEKSLAERGVTHDADPDDFWHGAHDCFSMDAEFSESDHPRGEGGQFGSGGGGSSEKPNSPHEGKAGEFTHHGRADLAKQGFKPKGRDTSGSQHGAALVAWKSAQNTGKPATAVIGGRGWTILRDGDKVPHGTPHMTVSPEGVLHAYNPKPLGSDTDPDDFWRGAHGKIPGPHGLGERALRFAEDSVRTYDPDGRLRVARTPISKANVCPYLGREIPGYEELGLDAERVYQLLRDPDELARAAPSFNGVQLLRQHTPVNSQDHRPGEIIGTTGTDAVFEAPYLFNSLIVWADNGGIGDIEDESKKELSSAYRYRADMTPGTYQGQSYDGVMRDIVGNHVALVKEGRAGSDVVVGDSMPQNMETTDMTTKVLSRKAAMVQGALAVFLAPKLAKDARIDLGPVLVGISAKNYRASIPKIVTDVTALAKPKLAAGMALDALPGMLEQMAPVNPTEGIDADPESGLPMEAMPEKPADPAAKIRELLAGKVDDATMAALLELLGAGGPEAPPAAAPTPPAAPVPAAIESDTQPAAITQAAMDEAITRSVQAAEKRVMDGQRALREATAFVRPWVGDLPMALDSAEAVHRAALEVLGVDAKGVHPSALPTIIRNIPLPGAKRASAEPRIALDSAGAASFAERFPNVARIGRQ